MHIKGVCKFLIDMERDIGPLSELRKTDWRNTDKKVPSHGRERRRAFFQHLMFFNISCFCLSALLRLLMGSR